MPGPLDATAPPSASLDEGAPGTTSPPDAAPHMVTPVEPPSAAPAPPAAPPVAADPGQPGPVSWDLGIVPRGEASGSRSTAAGFPAHLQAMTDSVVRTGSGSTATLAAAADALEASGMERGQAVRQVFGRFPVGGLAVYSHDWWFPRFGPAWRLHQGTDVFAEHGTPVRAPASGAVTIANGGLGGLSVRVTEPDGTYWYLAHLSAVADGLAAGASVEVGDVVGYVGNSGNARTTPAHLHLEVHPGGGPAIDPKSTLDQFLAEAEAALSTVVATEVNATLPVADAHVEALLPSATPVAMVASAQPSAEGGGGEGHPVAPGGTSLLGFTPAGVVADPAGRRSLGGASLPNTPLPEQPVFLAAALAVAAGGLWPCRRQLRSVTGAAADTGASTST